MSGGGERAPIGIVVEAVLELFNPFAWAIFSSAGSNSAH